MQPLASADDILHTILAAGFTARLVNGALSVKPKGLPADLAAAIRANKPAIVELLTRDPDAGRRPPTAVTPTAGGGVVGMPPSNAPPPAFTDQEDAVNERAAILESDAGLPRAEAETAAVRGSGPCFSCHARRWWVSVHGAIVCAGCHPPAAPALVARWIDADECRQERTQP